MSLSLDTAAAPLPDARRGTDVARTRTRVLPPPTSADVLNKRSRIYKRGFRHQQPQHFQHRQTEPSGGAIVPRPMVRPRPVHDHARKPVCCLPPARLRPAAGRQTFASPQMFHNFPAAGLSVCVCAVENSLFVGAPHTCLPRSLPLP